MNRIAGILNIDGDPIPPGTLERMTRSLKLKERDRQAAWMEGMIGLGCASIGNNAGQEDGTPPYCHPNGRRAIVFDGRIDNRQDLAAQLKSELAGTGGKSTNEGLALAAYEKWGQDFVQHLTGDFALAIWDREKLSLICARDRLGVKPFYYFNSGGVFIFASTTRALLASGKIPHSINKERIADLLVEPGGGGLEGVDKTSTFYKNIYRLEPAHILVVQAGGSNQRRYWQLNPTGRENLKSEGEYIEAFLELFTEAVGCRLRDLSKPATMLSGGMDSSAIAGIGRRILAEESTRRLHAYAAISDTPGINRETPHITAVLAQNGFEPHLITETGLRGRLDELVKAIGDEDEPFDSLMNVSRVVYLQAGEGGCTAMLDGIDGDVLLSGSGQLTSLWKRGAFRTVIQESWGAGGLTAEYKRGREMFFGSLISTLTPRAPVWFRKMHQPFRTRKQVMALLEESIIDRDFAARCRLEDRVAMLDAHSPRPASDSQMEYHRIRLGHPFLTVGLERYERVASAFGIEARHPFTDIRLVEFCLGLPWNLKTQRGWTKYILRKALEPYLPAQVIWRRDKDSLMWEFNRVILKEKAAYFHRLTMDEGESLRPYVDMNKLAGFWREYLLEGKETHAALIWSGIALAMWLRQQRNLKASWA